MEHVTIQVGERVRAFHPRTLGVLHNGTVTRVGPMWTVIDFGPLHGGTVRVPRRHVLEVL
jgi:hypothetical protein